MTQDLYYCTVGTDVKIPPNYEHYMFVIGIWRKSEDLFNLCILAAEDDSDSEGEDPDKEPTKVTIFIL